MSSKERTNAIALLLLWMICSSMAFEVRQREDNDVLYNEIDPLSLDALPTDSSEPPKKSRRSHLESVAKHMTQWLRSVATEELGVTHMQQIYDSLSTVNQNVRYETIVDDITHKVCVFSDRRSLRSLSLRCLSLKDRRSLSLRSLSLRSLSLRCLRLRCLSLKDRRSLSLRSLSLRSLSLRCLRLRCLSLSDRRNLSLRL